MEPILTGSPMLAGNRPTLCTGNDYLSLTDIDPHDGSLHGICFLHEGLRGTVELIGNGALACPWVEADGRELPLGGNLRWERLEHWIPSFSWRGDGLAVRGVICCPPAEKGFLYLLEIRNEGSASRRIRAGLRGAWQACRYAVFRPRPLAVNKTAYQDPWTGALVWEAFAGVPLAALAWGIVSRPGSSTAGGGVRPLPAGVIGDASLQNRNRDAIGNGDPDGARIPLELEAGLVLGPGESGFSGCLAALNAEADGAATTLVHLRRLGHENLLRSTLEWLSERRRPLDDPTLDRVLNSNLFFNRFFACGRALDTGKGFMVTSRSPRYYVSGAFWARDAFLWSLPGLRLTDPETAAVMVRGAAARHLEGAGEHAHYLNGVILYPGFELDQLCAHVFALAEAAGLRLPGAPVVPTAPAAPVVLFPGFLLEAARELRAKLVRHRHRSIALYRTFLDPTDDPVDLPYLTYDNALAWRALRLLAVLQRREGDEEGARECLIEAARVREAVDTFCRVTGPYGLQYAWAVEPGEAAVPGDNPAGSLLLLPHYDFCDAGDLVFRNTVRWIYSSHNPHRFDDGCPYPGLGGRHAPGPWVLGLAGALLSGCRDQVAEALEVIRRAPFDGGLACETYDPLTGEARSGAAFASLAGFLGYALWEAGGRPPSPNDIALP